MALVTSFGFTNTTASTHKSVDTYDMKEMTNYSKPDHLQKPGSVRGYWNKTCNDNAPEVIQVKYQEKKSAPQFPVDLYRPTRAKGCKIYGFTLFASCATTDTSDPTYESDAGVQVKVEIVQNKDPRITPQLVETIWERAASLMYREDGTCRLDELSAGGIDFTTN